MGLIGFQCPEVNGANRLRMLIGTLEFAHNELQQLPDKRLVALIGFDFLRLFR